MCVDGFSFYDSTLFVFDLSTPFISFVMLSLAKQHLQQHAQLASSSAAALKPTQQQQKKKVSRDELLADFPLAPVSHQPKASTKKKSSSLSPSIGQTQRSAAFKSATQRDQQRSFSSKIISSSALKRAKKLSKKLPRPSLLEQAERSLDTSATRGLADKNLRLLTHQSERKKKTKEAMKKILLATTLPSRHAQTNEEDDEDEDDERDDFDDAELDEFMD